MRWFCISLLLLGACAKRDIVVTAQPADAIISVDGVEQGAGPVTQRIRFKNHHDVHIVSASREGYQDKSVQLTRDDRIKYVVLELDPTVKHLTFTAVPVPAIFSINGAPQGLDPVTQVSRDLPFGKDENDNWTRYTITASRPGYATAQVIASYNDPSTEYTLLLQPTQKDISITTDPPGARVAIDDKVIGSTPGRVPNLAFNYDAQQNKYAPRRITLSKPGYDPLEAWISWDDGKMDYSFELHPRKKTVRILTDPPGATVTIDGRPVPPNAAGIPTINLIFKPLDDNGQLPTYTAKVTKESADGQWNTVTVPIGWDGSKTDYLVTLRETKGQFVPDLTVALERDSEGMWQVMPRVTQTPATKETNEAPGKEPPILIYQAPPAGCIGTLAISPAGTEVAFTLLSGTTKADLRSQIMTITTDGTAIAREITDGKALDIMPSYTPSGDQIVFSSNRSAGRRLNIWRKSLTGGVGIQQLTDVPEQDLWPTIDAAPKPRLFYEALSDTLADAQLFESPVEGIARTNLSSFGVSQPRISPRADAIIFTSVNQRTGNREIYRISDRGGMPVDLTNDPDSDSYDPSWSRNGAMIAFTSNRGLDEQHQHNPDIWIMDPRQPDKPIQITTNGSVDDCPVWDPDGTAIYFRSNRGGQWGIWKIAVK
jgi:hypothetical protein